MFLHLYLLGFFHFFQRVGEEKEDAMKSLDEERHAYEEELSTLQQQQHKVMMDRNGRNLKKNRDTMHF